MKRHCIHVYETTEDAEHNLSNLPTHGTRKLKLTEAVVKASWVEQHMASVRIFSVIKDIQLFSHFADHRIIHKTHEQSIYTAQKSQ